MRRVNTAEVEMRDERGNRILMILKSFTKTHRQACVTAVKQTQARIGALGQGCADQGAVIQVL